MKKLSKNQVEARVSHLDGWIADQNIMLQKEFRFSDFAQALAFLNFVAEEAEDLAHHPDMCISYNSVVCMLTTHEKEGLTEADFKLAKKIAACEAKVRDL